jgi:hypothetical protein
LVPQEGVGLHVSSSAKSLHSDGYVYPYLTSFLRPVSLPREAPLGAAFECFRFHTGQRSLCFISRLSGTSALQIADKVFRMQTSLYRDLVPEQLHQSRESCEVQQSDHWYQLAGAMIMDRRSTTPTGGLNYPHLVRLYERFFKCPFSY